MPARQNQRETMPHPSPTLVIVQFAGDFRKTFQELQSGGAESYYAQAHSVNGVASLVQGGRVVTICCVTDEAYQTELSNGLHAVGLQMRPDQVDEARLWQAIEAWRPTHLVLRSPWHHVLKMALRHKTPTILTIADSFNAHNLLQKIKLRIMARTWNRPGLSLLANHGRTSAKHLVQWGASPKKVIAWDWPHALRPHDFSAKSISNRPERPWQLLYAGSVCEAKGVGDLIRATRHLADRSVPFVLQIAGSGESETFIKLSSNLGLAEHIEFLGRRPHAEIIERMRLSDAVVVPSRHAYAEGFPMTLFEAVRTPIVASDHPMFTQALKHEQSAMIFEEKNARQMADRIVALVTNPPLYAALSQGAMSTWESLQVPVEWVELLRAWFVSGPPAFEQLVSRGLNDLRHH